MNRRSSGSLSLFSIISFVAHRAYYTRRFPPAEGETIDRLEWTPLTVLAALLSLLALLSTMAYVISPFLVSWGSAGLPYWLRWLGVAPSVVGFILLEWSHRALGRNWSDQPRITRAQQLVQNGPYKWIRHPIYAGFLLILGSTLLISSNWLAGGAWISSVALDGAVRMRYKEQAMLQRFGAEYQEYKRRTGAILPRF